MNDVSIPIFLFINLFQSFTLFGWNLLNTQNNIRIITYLIKYENYGQV